MIKRADLFSQIAGQAAELPIILNQRWFHAFFQTRGYDGAYNGINKESYDILRTSPVLIELDDLLKERLEPSESKGIRAFLWFSQSFPAMANHLDSHETNLYDFYKSNEF